LKAQIPSNHMTIGDWLNSLVNVVVGLLFGVAAYELGALIGAGQWVTVVFIIGLVVMFLFFVQVFDRLIDWLGSLMDWLLPSDIRAAIRAARIPAPRQRKPLARTLSLPAGFVLGVLAAALGLGKEIMAAL
jgi:divalent metal cation (Fe/Co/Zn/Cd) transporter